MRQVFLDYQSSTPVLPEVFEAMRPYFTERFGIPASLHQHGLRVRDAVEKARAQVAGMIHAESPDEIIFTSGGTESTNLAIKGVAEANRGRGNHLVLTEIEHPAVMNSADFLEKHGYSVTRVKVDREGMIDPAMVGEALRDETILVCIHQANHDIGTIGPVKEVARITSERGIPLFVDAVASAGWMPIDVQSMGVQLLSFAPHRFYGPKGVGVLYRNRRVRLAGFIHGGVQEGGRRAGTENVPGIVGAGMAAEISQREIDERIAHTSKLQRQFWEGIRENIEFVRLNGPEPGPARITTNLNVSFEFVEGEAMMLRLDMQGIAVASGTNCASKALKISHVLSGIGLDHSLAQGNIIVSFGRETTEEEIGYAIETVSATVRKLRGMSPLWDDFQSGRIDSLIRPRRDRQPSP